MSRWIAKMKQIEERDEAISRRVRCARHLQLINHLAHIGRALLPPFVPLVHLGSSSNFTNFNDVRSKAHKIIAITTVHQMPLALVRGRPLSIIRHLLARLSSDRPDDMANVCRPSMLSASV